METILGHALALFCSCLAVHILVWRIWKVRSQGMWLSLIFLIAPTLSLGIDLVLPWVGIVTRIEWAQTFLTLLLHYALSVSYMLLYTGITGFSPSIAILQRIATSLPAGLLREELAPAWFTDEMLSGARHNNLKHMELISESAEVLRLRARGRFIDVCFLIFRRVLSLPDIAKG
jgi:hypothetical protein